MAASGTNILRHPLTVGRISDWYLLLANHRPTDPAFQDIMNIKQNPNRAAGLLRQLLAF